MGRLADLRPPAATIPGTRVVIDLRPLQEPERAPVTAAYLARLLAAYAAHPLDGESLLILLRALRPDPTAELVAQGLRVAGRRWLPPTARGLRSAGSGVDALLLRGAEVRSARGAEASGAIGAVFHSAGGAAPLRSSMPVVATLLDLAPWELPERYARSVAARLGRRARERALRGAARVLVTSQAAAAAAERLLGVTPERLTVVPLAGDDAFRAGAAGAGEETLASLRAAHGIPERYLVVGGRYDARSDLTTVLSALRMLREAPADGPSDRRGRVRGEDALDSPPVLVLAGAAGHEATGPSRVAALVERYRVADLVRLTPALPVPQLAALEAGAVGHVQPALSDANGLAALDALAAGVPVICSRTGSLPEIVGPAGIVVEPRDPGRMASALRALWADGAVARQVTHAAHQRAEPSRRRWSDVARETRAAYVGALGEQAAGRVGPGGERHPGPEALG